METTALVYALLSQTAHQVTNSSKIIPGHFPKKRHAPCPSTETASVGSGGWSLPSRLEELLYLNMHGELARICKTYKVHEICFCYSHVGISYRISYKMNPGTGSAHIPPTGGLLSAACNLLTTYLSLVHVHLQGTEIQIIDCIRHFHKVAFLRNIFNAIFLGMRRMGTSHLLSFSIFTFIS